MQSCRAKNASGDVINVIPLLKYPHTPNMINIVGNVRDQCIIHACVQIVMELNLIIKGATNVMYRFVKIVLILMSMIVQRFHVIIVEMAHHIRPTVYLVANHVNYAIPVSLGIYVWLVENVENATKITTKVMYNYLGVLHVINSYVWSMPLF